MTKKTRRRPPPDDGNNNDVPHHHSRTALSSFPSPSSSSSSSDFEFAVSLSPTTRKLSSQLCPADELFYKGQLLPLHLSPRISMVRTLLLASSSGSSSSDTTTTASRDSNGSSNDSTASFSGDLLLLAAAAAAAECDSSRPSSVTEDDTRKVPLPRQHHHLLHSKYFSTLATKFSSVFHRNRKDHNHNDASVQNPIQNSSSFSSSATTVTTCYFTSLGSTGRKTSSATNNTSSAKEVIKKYVKKVKPFYEKLSRQQQNSNHHDQKQHQPQQQKKTFSFSVPRGRLRPTPPSTKEDDTRENGEDHRSNTREIYSHSFSGNLRYPRKKRCSMAASCPSSIRSSPSHSGLLTSAGASTNVGGRSVPVPAVVAHHHSASATSMEELQSAIQGAIAHCKNSMAQSAAKN